jgi:GNAT superfamily N-acetyltransferase
MAGAACTPVRPMTAHDLTDGMRLAAAAGWNQTEADWRLLLEANADGCFVADQDARVVGTVTTLRYGARLAWIGMVLVDPAHRRQGIATRLVARALEAVADAATVMLDATPAGREVYGRLGFREEQGLRRVAAARAAGAPPRRREGIEPIDPARPDEAITLDARAFGADRGALLRALLAAAPALGWQRRRDGRVVACCLGRPGARYTHVGPVVAETEDDAAAVVDAALAAIGPRPVALDVLDVRAGLLGHLAALGFAEERPFVRMARGADAAPPAPHTAFAACGPEYG